METDFMWKLPSGAFAEQVLYNRFENASKESLVHSFVIDVHDHTVQDSFLPGDWQAILDTIPAWPDNDELLARSMTRFWKVRLNRMALFSLLTYKQVEIT